MAFGGYGNQSNWSTPFGAGTPGAGGGWGNNVFQQFQQRMQGEKAAGQQALQQYHQSVAKGWGLPMNRVHLHPSVQAQFGVGGVRAAQAANQGLMQDFQHASGLAGERNQRIDDVLGRMRGSLDSLDEMQARSDQRYDEMLGEGGRLEQFRGTVDQAAQNMRGYAKDLIGRADRWGEESASIIKSALKDFDQQSMAHVSAAAAGIHRQGEMQRQQLHQQMMSQGAHPDQVKAAEWQVRQEGVRAAHENVSMLQEQMRQANLQGRLAGAGLLSQVRGQQHGQVERAYGMKAGADQMRVQAQQWDVAMRQQLIGQQMQEQFQLTALREARLGQYAQGIMALTKSFPSMHEMIVTMAMNQHTLGNRPPLSMA